MATKKLAPKETSRLTIITNSAKECIVKMKGDPLVLTAALASLMSTEDENNQFREMMSLAIQVVLHDDKSKKTVKKKAAPKKKK